MKKMLFNMREFAKVSGVEASTLRYWDEIGLFSPIARYSSNNYRCYSAEQLLALNYVTTLSELEIPLKVISELRQERSPQKLLKLLEKQERRMDMELRALRLRSSIIHARQDLIRYGLTVDESAVTILYREDKELIMWPPNEYKEGDTFIKPLTRFVSQTAERHINLSFPVGGYYKSMENFKKAPLQPDNFFSIDPLGTHVRAAGDYLVGFARGYYGEVGDLPDRMCAYASENKLIFNGPLYLMYLFDETCTHDTSQYLSQACIAVKQTESD